MSKIKSLVLNIQSLIGDLRALNVKANKKNIPYSVRSSMLKNIQQKESKIKHSFNALNNSVEGVITKVRFTILQDDILSTCTKLYISEPEEIIEYFQVLNQYYPEKVFTILNITTIVTSKSLVYENGENTKS